MTPGQRGARWHAALAYALLGPPVLDLAETGAPRIADLAVDLYDASGGADALRRTVSEAQVRGVWPYEVPGGLRAGLGAAQFAAAWSALLATLATDAPAAWPVLQDRALTPDERRLLADRPPHHGD